MEEIIKIITNLHRLCEYKEDDSIQSVIESTDLEEVFESAYNSYFDENMDITHLVQIIEILSYLENETSIPSPVSDTIYDKILEVIHDNDIDIIGTSAYIVENDETVKQHKYPELRGSLKKVHFIAEEDIPKKDSRRSLEKFLETALKGYVPKDGFLRMFVDYKWDGTSDVFECDGNSIENVLTRYKVKENLGKIVTHIYDGKTPRDIFEYKIPGQFYDMGEYGVQTEIIMKLDKFEEYKKYMKDDKCNRRSAAMGIINRTKENFEPELLEFLEVIPLQISTYEPVEGNPDCIVTDDRIWIHVGMINQRHQYIAIYYHDFAAEFSKEDIMSGDFVGMAKSLYETRKLIEFDASSKGYPIDGMVITFNDMDLIYNLGRSSHKNNFQVAYKFPAGVKKTVIKDVIFQVGKIAGTITPVAIFEPIVMNGNTLSNVGLSNKEKLERLDLHIGDEIMIQYDIVPKIMVDDTCQKNPNGKKIEFVTECPKCGKPIYEIRGRYRCINENCPAKLIGRLSNYTRKMNIPYFGIETITDLVNMEMVSSITDLYKLSAVARELSQVPGYGEKSVSKLVQAPLQRTEIYPHEVLGSLGIPDISLATMEKICRVIHIDELINNPEVVITRGLSINGIGEKTAKAIYKGISDNLDLIKSLIPWFTFKEYSTDELIDHVVFTKVRDAEFSQYLNNEKSIATKNSVPKALAVIVPNGKEITSAKKTEAIEKGIPILTLSEAKKKWGYTK